MFSEKKKKYTTRSYISCSSCCDFGMADEIGQLNNNEEASTLFISPQNGGSPLIQVHFLFLYSFIL
jgi:hypothetical protein